ncbi:unnamed protein product [Cochlearia groenlandica]
MDKNHKKGHNRKGFHLKKHRKADDSRSFDPRTTTTNTVDEKPVLFQLGSIEKDPEMFSDVRLKPDPEIATTSRSVSSSDNTLDSNAKDRKYSLSFDSSRQNKDLLSLSLKLSELQGSSDTPRSQVSGVTHASLEPPTLIMSPSLQMMDREEGSDQPRRNLEKNLSNVSNDSLFSLSIGDNTITRDELFSYRDFKAGELLKSGELLSFCPSLHVPIDSSELGKSFDIDDDDDDDKESGTSRDDSDDNRSFNSDISWRNIGESNNYVDDPPSSSQSVSHPIAKKKKKKKKKSKKAKKKKSTQQQQHQQKPKKRCSWLCCKSTGPCLSCCKWPCCDYDFSCFKRIKCCACCCMWPKCCCSWLFCCHWSCWGCCSRYI